MGVYGPGATSQPFDEWERAYLQRFAEGMRRHREHAGISRRQLWLATGLSVYSLRQMENARQRTRPSTIRRVARALADAMGTATDDDIADELLELIGPAAANESPFMVAIERRRDRFVKKLAEDPNAELRPPPRYQESLESELRFAERKLRELQGQRRAVEAKEEALQRKEAALERLDRQIQQRELELWQRRNGQTA